jgi:hypothetical protein
MPRLNVREAATYCRCHPGTLNKLRGRGGGPTYSKPFSRVFYDTDDLDAWIEASKRQSAAPVGHRAKEGYP